MSSLAGLDGLKHHLLKTEPAWSYSTLVKLAGWLCENTDRRFLLADAAQAIDAKVNKVKSLFRNLPCHSQKTSQAGKAGNYWDRREVLNLLQIHGVVELQIGGSFALNPRITGNYTDDLSRFHVYPNKDLKGTKGKLPSVDNHNLIYVPSLSIRPYKAGELQAYDQLWQSKFLHYHYSFYTSFQVAQAIVSNVVLEQHTAQINGAVDPCWVFQGGLDPKGYAHVTNPWLQSALPNAGVLAADLPSTGAARLVSMVNHPSLDWKDATGHRRNSWVRLSAEDKGMVAHHTCQKTNCVNPFHVTPLSMSDHALVHKCLNAQAELHLEATVTNLWQQSVAA
jgi:hypothetical protein